jgi:DNA primase
MNVSNKEPSKFVDFDSLKRAVSIIQILDRYGLTNRLHRSGDSLTGVCPLHAGHNPTQFRVSLSKNCWICFGDCHGGGSIVDFVSRKEGVGIRDAALLIQDWFGLDQEIGNTRYLNSRPSSLGETALPELNQPLKLELQHLDQKHPYLSTRGITPETINTFGLGYCHKGLMSGWIVIPIHNSKGQLVAYAGRWPGEPITGTPKYKLPRGFRKSLELFNLHRALQESKRQPLTVVEGFFGCMKLWQAGFRRTVALMGSMLSQAQETLIVETVGLDGRVILMFDEDESGRKGRNEARQRLAQKVNVKVIEFPQKGQQPDGLSTETLRQIVN